MSFFSKMERRYGRFAIHNLMNYIVVLYAMGVVVQYTQPGVYWEFLALDADAILHGQIWRIVTFMVWPPSSNFIFNVFVIYLYYSLGTTLERVWGAFRFNVYFFMGVLGHILAALIGYLVFGQFLLLTTANLNMSLFFAFALTFPETSFYIYFVLPVKAKWLAVFYGVITLWTFLTGTPYTSIVVTRCEIVLSFANFIIFFLLTRNYTRISPKEIKRKREFHSQVRILPAGATHHKCAVCGRTEQDGDLEFRFCSKCEGSYEYCQDHLYTHKHVTSDSLESGHED